MLLPAPARQIRAGFVRFRPLHWAEAELQFIARPATSGLAEDFGRDVTTSCIIARVWQSVPAHRISAGQPGQRQMEHLGRGFTTRLVLAVQLLVVALISSD